MHREVTAFSWVPDFAQGYVRDLRVRWALEEAGLPYTQDLIDHEIKNGPAYRCRQPFGQVPAYREGTLDMFESGAIVLHIAEQSEQLSPRDRSGRARMTSWVLAALNSIEPLVSQLADIKLFHKGESWTVERLPQVETMLRKRFAELANWLGTKSYLEGEFTAGDLIMTTVLRDVADPELVEEFANLAAYVERCQTRPAFVRAMRAQLEAFHAHALG